MLLALPRELMFLVLDFVRGLLLLKLRLACRMSNTLVMDYFAIRTSRRLVCQKQQLGQDLLFCHEIPIWGQINVDVQICLDKIDSDDILLLSSSVQLIANIRNTNVDPQQPLALACCARLKTIVFEQCQIHDLNIFENAERLAIFAHKEDQYPADLDAQLKHLIKLNELTLAGVLPVPLALEWNALGSLRKLSILHYSDLQTSNLMHSTLASLTLGHCCETVMDMVGLPRLESLRIVACHPLTTLKNLPFSLRHLHLEGSSLLSHITGVGGCCLSQLSQLMRLDYHTAMPSDHPLPVFFGSEHTFQSITVLEIVFPFKLFWKRNGPCLYELVSDSACELFPHLLVLHVEYHTILFGEMFREQPQLFTIRSPRHVHKLLPVRLCVQSPKDRVSYALEMTQWIALTQCW